jgi:hypothetical protein
LDLFFIGNGKLSLKQNNTNAHCFIFTKHLEIDLLHITPWFPNLLYGNSRVAAYGHMCLCGKAIMLCKKKQQSLHDDGYA